MATLDWSQCPAVESVPGRLSGAWVFRDTRMPVSAVFENLEAGATIEEIIDQLVSLLLYGMVQRDQFPKEESTAAP